MKKPGEARYPHVFSPGRIGKLESKNRIKYASTETNFNTKDGFVTDEEVAYMEAQARGGAGIVTTQGAYTDPKGEGKGYVGMMGIWDDKFLPGLKRIADAIRRHGALSVCQLMHCGRVGGVELDYCVGPSAVPQKLPIFKPQREMTLEEIETCIRQHVEGARRIVEAGFDMVEISGIVGYLISNFISKYTNKRTDKYGGDINGRCTFMREILEGIRREVGPDVPIIIRLCGEELLADRGGNTPEESLQSIKIAEAAGIDCLSVTAGWQESYESVISRDIPMGHWLYIAERMKKNLKVPVSMAYRLFVPEFPEEAIAKGHLDFWEMCRPMIADPELPRKIAENRQEDIIPCIACNLCLARLFRDQPLQCTVRPTLGHEGDKSWGYHGFEKVQNPKKVVVVGAGPSGMQAAVVARKRGHDVTLYDKQDKPGGQLLVSCHGPYGDGEFQRLNDSLATECRKAGVKFELGRGFREDTLKEKVDAVILATGAAPEIPKDAPGNVVSIFDVMTGKAKVGEKVVIIGGTGVGIAAALFLNVKGGYKISLVESGKKVGRDVNPSYIWRYTKKLKEGKVEVFTETQVEALKPDCVVLKSPDGKTVTVPADTIVYARLKSENALEAGLKGKCDKLLVIGDALKVRRCNNAMHDGYEAGMEV
jgi:2,4-dienoyl-CoA reductase (NADPH2)